MPRDLVTASAMQDHDQTIARAMQDACFQRKSASAPTHKGCCHSFGGADALSGRAYHVGETVCGLQRATLTPGGADAIVYWTLYGVRAPWLRRVLARLLTQLHAVCGGKTAVLCVGQVSGIGIDMLCVLGGHIDRLGGCVGHLHRHAGCVSGTCCVCLER
eukprot:3751682-Rhodomonas_salina.1